MDLETFAFYSNRHQYWICRKDLCCDSNGSRKTCGPRFELVDRVYSAPWIA